MFDKRLLLAIPFFCLSGLALAGSTSYETARVVDVQPIVDIERTPVDREVCRQQEVLVEKRHSHTPTILGAIVGGVVGNQFGGGSGRRAATVAGAALGDRKSTRLNSSHVAISYAVFCLKKKKASTCRR